MVISLIYKNAEHIVDIFCLLKLDWCSKHIHLCMYTHLVNMCTLICLFLLVFICSTVDAIHKLASSQQTFFFILLNSPIGFN